MYVSIKICWLISPAFVLNGITYTLLKKFSVQHSYVTRKGKQYRSDSLIHRVYVWSPPVLSQANKFIRNKTPLNTVSVALRSHTPLLTILFWLNVEIHHMEAWSNGWFTVSPTVTWHICSSIAPLCYAKSRKRKARGKNGSEAHHSKTY